MTAANESLTVPVMAGCSGHAGTDKSSKKTSMNALRINSPSEVWPRAHGSGLLTQDSTVTFPLGAVVADSPWFVLHSCGAVAVCRTFRDVFKVFHAISMRGQGV